MDESSELQPRRPFWRRPRMMAGLLAGATLLSTLVVTQSATAAPSVPRFSGEQLISGLIYDTGPVADQYPELVLGSGKQVDRAGTAAFLPKLYAETERRAAGFRSRFGDAVYSGDRLRIQRTTTETVRVLGDSLVALVPELEPILRKYNSDGAGQAAWYYENAYVWADTAAVMEIGAVVALAVALTVVVTAIDFTPAQPDPTTFAAATLLIEIWSDNVARTLAPR